MVRGIYINRSTSERMLVRDALDRYLAEVSSTKRTLGLFECAELMG